MEWVKCRERLPEKEGRFCVRLTNGCISTDYYTKDDNQSDPKMKWKHYLVSAWLTLPEVYYPGCESESDWKRVRKYTDIASLSEGYYFVTVGDLVHVVDKCEQHLWMREGEMPYRDVDAVMSIPIHSENNKLNLF